MGPSSPFSSLSFDVVVSITKKKKRDREEREGELSQFLRFLFFLSVSLSVPFISSFLRGNRTHLP